MYFHAFSICSCCRPSQPGNLARVEIAELTSLHKSTWDSGLRSIKSIRMLLNPSIFGTSRCTPIHLELLLGMLAPEKWLFFCLPFDPCIDLQRAPWPFSLGCDSWKEALGFVWAWHSQKNSLTSLFGVFLQLELQLCLGIYRVLFGLAHSVSLFPKTSGYARPRPKIWCGKVQSCPKWSVHFQCGAKTAGMSGEDTEAIMYFDFLLPRLKEAYPDVGILVG